MILFRLSSPLLPQQKRTLLLLSTSSLKFLYYLTNNNNKNNNNNNIVTSNNNNRTRRFMIKTISSTNNNNSRIKSQTIKTTTTTKRMMMTTTTMSSSASSSNNNVVTSSPAIRSSLLSSLPNSLKVEVIINDDDDDDGHVVEFTVVEEEEQDEEEDEGEEQTSKKKMKKKAKIGEDSSSNTNPTTPTPTPTTAIYYPNEDDYVIQYHRQIRKFHANQKSIQKLTIQQHLHIVYEDNDIIVVNKPSGILCVPGIHNKPTNLLQLVCEYCNLPTTCTNQKNQIISQYIVHRLDMDTSGIVVFAKRLEIQKQLHQIFRERDLVKKQYTALLCGHLPYDKGHIKLPIHKDYKYPPFMRIATPRSQREVVIAVQDIQKSKQYKKLITKNPKQCHTEFIVIQREYLKLFDNNDDDDNNNNNINESSSSSSVVITEEEKILIPVTRISLIPHTGRTHQLRVHCAAIGYPIVGDPAYGLYGEANPNGGLDYNCNNTNLNCNNESLSQSQSLLDIQKQITKLRPPHHKNNTMCLHSTKLTLKKKKQHPNTISSSSSSSSGSNETIIEEEEEEWIVPSPF